MIPSQELSEAADRVQSRPVDLWDWKFPTQPQRGTMSETREDHSASRMATYFVFAFLLAAILETMIATLG